MSLSQRILQRVFVLVTWRPTVTICIALTLAGLSLLYTKNHIGFLTSQRSLISSDNRLLQLSRQLDQFDDLDNFVIVIENKEIPRTLHFLRNLVVQLEADQKHYSDVFYRVDPKALRPWALLYLSTKDLVNVRHKLEEHPAFIKNLAHSPNITEFFRLANAEISSGIVEELFTGFLSVQPSGSKAEPVDLTLLINTLKSMKDYLAGNQFSSPWATFFSGESWDEDSEGYFWTENKRYLILFVTPAKGEPGFGQAQGSLRALRQTIAKVRSNFPDVQAGVTGQEALNVDEMTLSLEDMSLATVISLVGLTILLTLFWKGSRRPWFGISELLIALCLTFGLTTLVVGHLNILSVVFAPLVLGLGIDYGTHWLSRYQEEVQKAGVSRKEAIRMTMVNLGPGLVTAGLSAALSFFPLVLTGFRGLAELGVICSMGMLMTTTTSMCVLPAITLLFDRGSAQKAFSSYCATKSLFRFTDRRALTILTASSICLALCLIVAKDVTFDLNMLRLQSKSAESVIWEMKILSESKRSSMYGAVLAHSIEEVERKAKALESLPSVSEVQSVASLLPQHQEEKMRLLKQLAPLLPQIGDFHDSGGPVNLQELESILSKISFKMLDPSWSESDDRSHLEEQMMQVRGLIQDLREHFESASEAKIISTLGAFNNALIKDLEDKMDIFHVNAKRTRPMVLDDLPENLLKRFVGENRLYLIRVFPTHDIWEPEVLRTFVQELRTVDLDVVGDPVTLYTFTKEFRDACVAAVIYALMLIAVLLLFTFRSLVYALLAMMPLFVGTVWTLGLIRCFGINLNLANSVFMPMIVGAGVEYAIIILQRWIQGGNGNNVLPFSTGKGVLLAGLSTTIGFASLMISSHQGVYSLGLLTTVGSLCVLAAAIFLLPATMHLLPVVSKKWAPREVSVPFPKPAKE